MMETGTISSQTRTRAGEEVAIHVRPDAGYSRTEYHKSTSVDTVELQHLVPLATTPTFGHGWDRESPEPPPPVMDKNWIRKNFKKRECTTFVEDPSSNGRRCQCGDDHNKMDDPNLDGDVSHWDSARHSSERPTDAFGKLQFAGCSKEPSHFLRLSGDTSPDMTYRLLTECWSLKTPNLVVSVVGGKGTAKVKPWVREVLRKGLVKSSQSTGAWIVTEGLREGIGRCVGEAVKDHAIAASSVSPNKVIALGIVPWGLVHNRQQLVEPEGSFPAEYSVQNTAGSCCLDTNHQAFLLVDDGSVGRRGAATSFRAKLEECISKQHSEKGLWDSSSSINIPVLCMLISGDATMLERVDQSLKNSTPWLVLAGSRGVADLLSDILECNEGDMEAGLHRTNRVREWIKKNCPSAAEEFNERIRSILENRNLITVYHWKQEGPADFDRVLLKALVGEGKHREASLPTEQLKLAVILNRVDFAKSEFFCGDIAWTDQDLEESMTYALVNDKPQFVRLFAQHGFNILDYLTYGKLEGLYSRVANTKAMQVYNNMLHCHPVEQREISLSEVSHVLKKLMGNECEPFYPPKVLLEKEGYRNDRCGFPWASLFIWAVLQNRSDMAVFFWEMAGEPVLSALSACKMLRALSKEAIKTKTKHSMKELAWRFEKMAHDVFGSCYQNDKSEKRSFTLLKRKSSIWGKTTCLRMGMAAKAHLFFSHDGVQALLSRIWWGGMKRRTEMWKLLLAFFCPILLYTNLIEFRKPKDKLEKAKKDQQEWWKNDAETKETDSLTQSAATKGVSLSIWRQFWRAPVTSFLGKVLMNFLFLLLFAYVLIVDFKPPPPVGPAITEYVLYFWAFTITCEEIEEAFFMGDRPYRQRIRMYMQNGWNKCDLIAITLFIIGLFCRMFEWSYESGRCVLCIDYMVFMMRLIHIFAIHRQLGPKIIIVGKMMKDLFVFLFILGVWLMAYGVANQALLYSYDPSPDHILRQVFHRPYLNIFGIFPEDVDVGEHLDMACTDNVTKIKGGAEPCRSLYNDWLVVVLLCIYLLVTNILLINLVIAMFSYTFSKVQEKSDIYWKFQRYTLLLEYHSRPSMAPPFIILSHLYRIIRRNICDEEPVKNTFEDTLTDKEAADLTTWETIQKENFLTAQSKIQRGSDSEKIKRMAVKVDSMQKQLAQTKTEMAKALNWIMDTLEKSPVKNDQPRPSLRSISTDY